jgi:tripartite-type tricarboxylate transporter receptor subunit TctC
MQSGRNIMKRRDVLALGLSSLAAPAFSSFKAFGQTNYPSHPVRLMVPFSAGGVVDVVGRQWAERVRPHLGGTVFVENQGGAGGTIAATDIARAQPDGHNLLLANTSIIVLNPLTMPKLQYDPIRDFAPISILAISASGIMVHPSVPAKTLQEFVTYAKANANKLSYGSAGTGTMTQLAGELFKLIIGAPEITHVPYRGAGPSISDLVGGTIPMATINVTGQLIDLHHAGKIRILAVTSPQRLQGLPEVPTAVESGMPNMIAQLFTGLFAPIKTPQPIIDKIYHASQATMQDPAMVKALTDSGLEPVTDSSPDKVRTFVQEEVARWTPVVNAAGLKQQ